VSTALTEAPTIRLLCWNMGAGGPGHRASWNDVREQEGVDAALLQEAPNPWRSAVDVDMVPSPGSKWGVGSNWAQTAVARLSDRVAISPLMMQPLGLDGPLQLGISRPGTLTVAKLTILDTSEEILLASIYAQWEGPISGGPGIFADASMHRILSDLSPLLSWRNHPVIVAGDFNSVLGTYVEGYGSNWTARSAGVFSRMGDLGLRLAGPQAPNGNQADPRPSSLPVDTGTSPRLSRTKGLEPPNSTTASSATTWSIASRSPLATTSTIGARRTTAGWRSKSDHLVSESGTSGRSSPRSGCPAEATACWSSQICSNGEGTTNFALTSARATRLSAGFNSTGDPWVSSSRSPSGRGEISSSSSSG